MLLLLNGLLFAELLLCLLLLHRLKNKYANKIVKVCNDKIHYLCISKSEKYGVV